MDTAKTLGKASLRAAVIMLSLLFVACASEPETPHPQKPKHARHKPQPPATDESIEYSADAYLLHLTLAELALEANPSDVPASAADFDIARSYTLQKQNSSALQPVIILEYALKGQSEHQRIAIPFSMPTDTDEFPNLNDAMVRLNSLSYTMYDLRLAVVQMPPPLALPLPDEGSTANAAEAAVSSRLQPLLKKATSLDPMVQARIELQLTRFFMRHKYKEPAYLAIENAKESLAVVDETSPNPDATRGLSKEIDAQEGLLYKTMPFTFTF